VHNIKAATYVSDPSPWTGRWQNVTETLWVTINEDITGSNFYDDIGLHDYQYKWHLPTPDFKVDILEIALVAAAFGSIPSHLRWNSAGDVNEDYMVNILDIATIARVFGWAG